MSGVLVTLVLATMMMMMMTTRNVVDAQEEHRW
jgi:hypothetical protein